MREKELYDPITGRLIATVFLNEDNRIEGTVRYYDQGNKDTESIRLVVKPKRNDSGYIDDSSCDVLLSKLTTNSGFVSLSNSNGNLFYISNKGGVNKIELKGMVLQPDMSVKFDGTSATLYGLKMTLSTTYMTSSNGDIKNLSELKLIGFNGTTLKSNYLEVGEGDRILSSHMFSNTEIELVRKVYKDMNSDSPLFISIKNLNSSELNGVFNGQQVPTLGEIRNLR